MAEILITPRASGGLDDGDVLSAWNSRRIKSTHAQHICHWLFAGFSNEGLRPDGSLSRRWCDSVWQYTFTRTGPDSAERVETDSAGNVTAVDAVTWPTGKLDLFLSRRRRHPTHRIFGRNGAEVWHGGRSLISATDTDRQWSIIQTHSDHEPSSGPCDHCGQDHSLSPWGRRDLTDLLAVRVTEFNEVEAQSFEEPDARSWAPGETITDPDGTAVNPSFANAEVWQHPTGGWQYWRDGDGTVRVVFRHRNIKVADWTASLTAATGRTSLDILDRGKRIGQQRTIAQPERAPWLTRRDARGVRTADVNESVNHSPIADAALLRNKREGRAGQRRPQ